jgi:hypothetical protein
LRPVLVARDKLPAHRVLNVAQFKDDLADLEVDILLQLGVAQQLAHKDGVALVAQSGRVRGEDVSLVTKILKLNVRHCLSFQ